MSLQWNESLSVGVKEIDEQHKELISRINNLLEACREGKGKLVIEEIVDFLEKYVVVHFSTEERYMDKYSYSETSLHKKEHKYFAETFSKIKDEHLSKNELMLATVKLNDLLVRWLINHIKKTDTALGTFLKEKK